jgi:anti-sigma B factor antagonist
MLEIKREEYKRADLIEVIGRIDGSNASELDDVFKGLADEGHYNVVADLSGVELMTSAGLRALVAALRESKKHRGDLRIANPSERMSEVLNLAGLDTIFSIYDDVTAAIGSF